MTMDRRSFLAGAAVVGGSLGTLKGYPRLGDSEASLREVLPPKPARAPLDILILGGTNLTGPHNVRYAVERGHAVTIFTRGQRQPGLFQDVFQHVEKLIGDRAGDLDALRGRTWDAVIDASGMDVAWTRESAELLRDAARTYLYISSTGVFYPYLTTDITESTEPALVDPTDGDNGAYRYGVMKALSEIEAKKVFGDRALIVRPGYIVGPLDSTNRGTYWPDRLRRGGEVLVPGRKTDQVQQIDVRDLTEWMVRCLENEVHGTFNVTGPGAKTSLEEFVYGVKAISSVEASWTWIEDYEFLAEHRVTFAIPWIMADGDNLGSQQINIDRAKAAGLTFRPLAQTATDTLEWFDSLSEEARTARPMVLTAEREAEVLATWKGRV